MYSPMRFFLLLIWPSTFFFMGCEKQQVSTKGQILVKAEQDQVLELSLVTVKIFEKTTIELVRKKLEKNLEAKLKSVDENSSWDSFRKSLLKDAFVYLGQTKASEETISDMTGRFELIPPVGDFLVTANYSRRKGRENEEHHWMVLLNRDAIIETGIILDNSNSCEVIPSLFFPVEKNKSRFDTTVEKIKRKSNERKTKALDQIKEEEAYNEANPDAVSLLRLLESRYPKPENMPTRDFLLSLTELNLSSCKITAIGPLTKLINLKRLDLYENIISDITSIKALKKLEELNLWRNLIIDVAPMSDLKSLVHLDLSRNQIVDISALANLENLTHLYLSRNQIEDLTPLAKLGKLKSLSIDRNRISDVTPLTELKDLTSLHIRGNQLTEKQKGLLKKSLPRCKLFFD